MVTDMMDIAKDLSLAWLYLGYYVAESRKMAYKARFGPAEIFKEGFGNPPMAPSPRRPNPRLGSLGDYRGYVF